MSERELRHELERLQAEARALKDELAAPHAPGFVARRDELKARKGAVDAEVQRLDAALREAKAQQAKTLVAVQQAREALRAAEQRRLTWEPWLALAVVFVAGPRVLSEDALRLPGGAVAALGLGLLFGDRVLRSVLPGARQAVPAAEPASGSPGLGALVVAVLAVLFSLPLLSFWWAQGRPAMGGAAWPGLALSLLGVMLAVPAVERARAAKRSPWLALASGAACFLMLLALDLVALTEAVSLQGYAEPTVARLTSWSAMASAALWVPIAVWWAVDRFWAPARRARLPVSLACVTAALVACGVVMRVDRTWGNWWADGGLERLSPAVLAVQLAVFGLALGVRAAPTARP